MLALITATYNSMSTLPGTLASIENIRDQVKSIFVDGRSTDGTFEYLSSYVDRTANAVLLAQEASGLYPALNQGILAAINDPEVTHIGMLHSDDKLNSAEFESYLAIVENSPAEVFYSDIEFHNHSGQNVRKWNAGEYSRFKLNTGWMPPHTSIIVAKNVYQRLGLYDPSFGTAADYEWIVRVMSELGDDSSYFPERTVTMLVGGASSVSLAARLRANAMDAKVWAGRSWLRSVLIRLFKPMRKLGQFILVRFR